MSHTFIPSTQHVGGRGKRTSDVMASLVYNASTKMARATHRETLSQKTNINKQKKKERDWGVNNQHLL